MKFQYDDGGREAAGFKGKSRDCVCRAIAIATGLPYRDVYTALNVFALEERRKAGRSSARTGVHKTTYAKLLKQIGWVWTPLMGIGTGCQVHLRDGEIPKSERLIVSVSRHLVAVINGVIHDTHDCSRNGTRCVYGYWRKA